MNADSSVLRRTSLAATLCLTSHAEYAAGVASGLPLWHPWGDGGHAGLAIGLPWLLPIAIDCYVVDALERRNGMDRWAALGILALSVIGGSAYVAKDLTEGVKAAGVGVVLVLVLARLYAKAKPSKADIEAESTAKAERQAADDARTRAEREAAETESRLRIEEARELAAIDAARVRAEAEADDLRIRAEADAEALKVQAAADLAQKEADRIHAASAAEIARVHAESTAELARIHAEAEAKRAQRPVKASTKPVAGRPQKPSTDAPSKDEAARLVASAIRDHEGPGNYVFKWQDWSAQHGGGRSFWFAAKAQAEAPVHLAKTANG